MDRAPKPTYRTGGVLFSHDFGDCREERKLPPARYRTPLATALLAGTLVAGDIAQLATFSAKIV
jgi:hypothetical protein